MSWLSIALFGVWPYIALTMFVIGNIWRWRTDQFGWTTRTSELSEKKLLMWAPPIFHFGMLAVLIGHLMGLVIPEGWMTSIGVSPEAYHIMAVSLGTVAGLVFTLGVVLLILRRFILKTRIRLVTRPGDIVMYILLGLIIIIGMTATLGYNVLGPGYDYRESIGVWLRSIFMANPAISVMAAAPWIYQLHAALALGLFAVWPFSRLVHMWSVPVGYLTRPPIVYRQAARV